MKLVKNKAATLLAFILFPVFLLGIFVSDLVWARIVKRGERTSFWQLFESPGGARAGGSTTSTSSGICCFPAGTLVAVAGLWGRYAVKPIEKLRLKDRVLTMDFGAGRFRRVGIKKFFKDDLPGSVYEICTAGGTKITATAFHHFVINEKNETRMAKHLKAGDRILVLDRERKWETVAEIRSYAYDRQVYNLELVSPPHNYFVSLSGGSFVLAHNICADGGSTTGGSTTCFRGETLVATKVSGEEFESKPMKDFKVGDGVLAVAFGGDGPKIVAGRIKTVSEHEADFRNSIEFRTESGASIISTDNHPFVVTEDNVGKRASDVGVGERLVVAASDPRWEKVSETRKFIDERVPAYNLVLEEEPHNYLVSLDGRKFVLAHNGSGSTTSGK